MAETGSLSWPLFHPGLIERCRSGEEPALAELYEGISAPVLRTALNILGDQAAAEDVLHDVYMKAIVHLDRWRGEARLTTWIYRMTVNECLSLRRRWKVRLKGAVTLSKQLPRALLPLGEEALMAAEFLQSLPERTRTMIVLRHVEGLTFAEIATVVGEPEGTIKAVCHRALKKGAERFA